jgi:NADH-quinone oxidoreductase subunit C/D
MDGRPSIVQELEQAHGEAVLAETPMRDEMPTLWIDEHQLPAVLKFLKEEVDRPFRTLFSLNAIDERARVNRLGQPASDFTLVYQLLSYERNADIRLKVGLNGEFPTTKTITGIWPAANWYEREIYDMFGIRFEGHPNLRRLLMPDTWEGHPLRKEHPARATELGHYQLPPEKEEHELDVMQFKPEEWGLAEAGDGADYMFLNMGPQHPGTHGLIRLVLQLDGEEILDAVPEVGFMHRGAEKMAERQTWHTYIPYTDRIDYLSGVTNNLPYVMAVEKLAGIEVPRRAQVIRVMLVEIFRLINHLVWYGTFTQDLGAMSPVFYTFNDRERLFDIISAITGARMHPSWFRIGGVADDLPAGWDRMVRDFLDYMPKRLREFDRLIMRNRIFRMRTQGVGRLTLDDAIEWGITGPNLRGCGLEWDWRKKRPYMGYEDFEFDIPTAPWGDCYARSVVRVEEMRQSLRIIDQCVRNMPAGPVKSDHHLATPPRKERTMHDIETLINHFLNVSWGPVIPAGEAMAVTEVNKGITGYYLISDGGIHSYRTYIRTPSFPHIQAVPLMIRRLMVPDAIAILGSIDYVLHDVDK